MNDLISKSEEIWKPIPKYEGIYEVSNLGNVRSVDRYLDCKIKFGCLVTVMDCEPSTQTDFENILPYFVGYDGETWNDIDGNVIPFEVIAWMPLPQPYQYDIGKTDSSKMRSQNKS